MISARGLRKSFGDFEAVKGIDVEVRVMAVPETWAPKVAGTFKKEVMNELADLGEKMGADPASWSNGVPD